MHFHLVKKPETNGVLQINLDGEWSVAEFRRFFYEIEYLYRLLLFVETHSIQSSLESSAEKRDSFFRSIDMAISEYALSRKFELAVPSVKALEFSSPGWLRIFGNKSTLVALQEILFALFDREYRASVKNHRTAMRDAESERLRVKIIEEKVNVLKKCGRNKELQSFVRERLLDKTTHIIEGIDKERIGRARMIKDD